MAGFPETAFVALGSNLGNSRAIVLQAMDRLQGFTREPLRRSSLWSSSPVDCPPDSPLFVNALVGLVPPLGETPESLVDQLQALEREFGRTIRKLRNEPRTLDLDLIAFGDAVRATKSLILPHPRAHERGFVLTPLAEIAPDLILPGQTLSVGELLKRLPAGDRLERIN